MEFFGVHKVLLHSFLEDGLGAANAEFPGQVTLNLVDSDGVSADVIVSTARGVAGVAVASMPGCQNQGRGRVGSVCR